MTIYEDSVATHLSKILNSDEHAVVIASAKWVIELKSWHNYMVKMKGKLVPIIYIISLWIFPQNISK